MATTGADQTRAGDDRDDGHWRWQFGVTVVLLAVVTLIGVFLLTKAASDDIVWQRRLYVYGTFEPMAFAAIGWLFGRELHRGEAKLAKASAEQARKDEATAREEAAGATKRETELRGKVEAAKVAARQIEGAAAQPVRPRGGGAAPVGLDDEDDEAATAARPPSVSALLDELFS